MSKFARIAACAAIALLVPVSYASAATQLTMVTAPDAVSRAVLSVPTVKFEDGAESRGDVPAAIARNYPQIIEQNFARMSTAATHAVVNNLTDVELQAIAQLYANANADAHRTGALLLIAADRMDGAHLARLSKFFDYAPVYDAITKMAPTKAQTGTGRSGLKNKRLWSTRVHIQDPSVRWRGQSGFSEGEELLGVSAQAIRRLLSQGIDLNVRPAGGAPV